MSFEQAITPFDVIQYSGDFQLLALRNNKFTDFSGPTEIFAPKLIFRHVTMMHFAQTSIKHSSVALKIHK